MTAKRTTTKPAQSKTAEAPETLAKHPFFGLELDPEQKKFRDAIWNDGTDIVFVDAAAGSGKTTIAVATSVIMVGYGKADEIVYVVHPCSDVQGYLPGSITEKSSVYFEPLYQALAMANEFPDKVIRNGTMSDKDGAGYVTAITDSYLRGSNIGASGRTILIIDEAQNYDVFSLRKVLTRACDGTKVIVIGHQLQCDLTNPRRSGFGLCMDHFRSKNNPRFAFCELKTCHRSLVARTADERWENEGV